MNDHILLYLSASFLYRTNYKPIKWEMLIFEVLSFIRICHLVWGGVEVVIVLQM